uniref:Galactose oxidase n=1 Tax=Rhizophagus irregularis (strain DAOM 181602 / DAOM 197198 / MUCL 43194) TaxID=747089 RepID=U9V3T5_RHIID
MHNTLTYQRLVLHSCATETNEWTIPTTNGIAPGNRREMNGVINNENGKFYVFGGLSDQFTGTENIIALNDMNIFDTISLTWSKGSTIYAPLPRADYTATLLSNGIIVFIGGRETNYFVDVDINQIVLYDTTINKWSSMTAQGVILENRNGHSAVLTPDERIIILVGKIMLPIFPKVLPIVLPIFQEHITDLNEEEVDSIAVFSQKISVKEVIYSTIPIEYPMTSEAGVATVFNVTGWTNQRDFLKILFFRSNIHLGSGGQGLIKDCPCFVDFDSDDWIKINHKQVENKTYAYNPSVDLSKMESITNKKNYHENDSIEFEEQQIALREKKL